MEVSEVQQMRALLRQDFFSFASFFAALKGRDNCLSESTFGPVCAWLQSIAADHVTRAWDGDPRNHLKTTLLKAWVLWLAFLEPDASVDSPAEFERAVAWLADRPWLKGKQTRIRWVGLTKPIACMQVEAIERLITEHGLVRLLLPEFHPDNFALTNRKFIWNSEEMALPCATSSSTEVFLSAAGVESQSTSLHFDLIIFDDPVNEKTYSHPNEINVAIQWLELAEPLLEIGDVTARNASTLLVCGNFWNYFDVRSFVEANRPEFDIFHRSCWTCSTCGRERCVRGLNCFPTSVPLWPERWSVEGLLARKRLNPVIFAAQYENDPESGDVTSFDVSRVRECDYDLASNRVLIYSADGRSVERELHPRDFRCVISIDPASSSDPQSCRFAIGLLAEEVTTGAVCKLDLWAEKAEPDQSIDAILDMFIRWRERGFVIAHIGIEGVGGQKFVEPALRSRAALRGVWQLSSRPLRNTKFDLIQFYKTDRLLTKQDRITQLLGWRINEGLLYVSRSLPNRELFMTELRRFPNGKTVDTVDETAYAEQLYSRSVRQEKEVEKFRQILKEKNLKQAFFIS